METPEQREERLRKNRERMRRRRITLKYSAKSTNVNEFAHKKPKDHQNDNIINYITSADVDKLPQESKPNKPNKNAEAASRRRQMETPEQREERLRKNRERMRRKRKFLKMNSLKDTTNEGNQLNEDNLNLDNRLEYFTLEHMNRIANELKFNKNEFNLQDNEGISNWLDSDTSEKIKERLNVNLFQVRDIFSDETVEQKREQLIKDLARRKRLDDELTRLGIKNDAETPEQKMMRNDDDRDCYDRKAENESSELKNTQLEREAIIDTLMKKSKIFERGEITLSEIDLSKNEYPNQDNNFENDYLNSFKQTLIAGDSFYENNFIFPFGQNYYPFHIKNDDEDCKDNFLKKILNLENRSFAENLNIGDVGIVKGEPLFEVDGNNDLTTKYLSDTTADNFEALKLTNDKSFKVRLYPCLVIFFVILYLNKMIKFQQITSCFFVHLSQ